MFDILIFLFESYFVSGDYPETEKLSVKLSAAGFEEDDIHQALSWLAGLRQLGMAEYPSTINQSGMRIYADLELVRISAEGLQFLRFLETNKIISAVEREMIIDRVVALAIDNLALDKVKLITLMVLWNLHEDLDPALIEDLLTPSDGAQIH